MSHLPPSPVPISALPSPRPRWRTALLLACAALFSGAAGAQVGLAQRQVDGLHYTLVYPTQAAARPTAFGPVTLDVAVDAAPAPGRRRLVVMSHGTGGNGLTDHALAAALVQAGLVVAQPLHRGDHAGDTRDAGPVAFARRPAEVSAVIDALAADADWGPRLALDRVGVHGMSAGGVTGLALAGAQWRLLNLVQHCLQHGQQDPGFCLQGALTAEQQQARLARFEAARGVPEAYLPPALTGWQGGLSVPVSASVSGAASASVGSLPEADTRPDPRIAAVTLAVPVAAPFSAESLARIRVPVGVVSADRDLVLLPQFHAQHVLRHCTACRPLAELRGGGHFDVLWPWPDSIARQVAAGQLRGGAPEPGFDAAQRTTAQARIAAFLREQLR